MSTDPFSIPATDPPEAAGLHALAHEHGLNLAGPQSPDPDALLSLTRRLRPNLRRLRLSASRPGRSGCKEQAVGEAPSLVFPALRYSTLRPSQTKDINS